MEDNKDIKINKGQLTKAEGGNLIPFESVAKARESGKKGGIASGIAKRKKKTMEQWGKYILELPPTQKEKEALETLGLITPDETDTEGNEINKGLMLMAQAYNEARKGNMRALSMMMSIQRSIEKKDESNTTNILEALNESVEKDWGAEAPIEALPEANTSPVANENAKIIEEAIRGEEE